MQSETFCNLQTLTKILGVSRQTIYRMMSDNTLREETHYRRFTDGGNFMFYIPQIVKQLKPQNAPLYLPMVEN
jgi:predicted DNA-binding transcriptional regulator AlpA